MKLARDFHLTYCTNIHPGETWDEVAANLRNFLPAIRRQFSPDNSFGVGLRLSAQAAEVLEQPDRLEELREFLHLQDCYVFTINGFPYGAFHGTRVKEKVYLPDWRDQARLDYTNRLARILCELLPDESNLEGSISTVPGAFKEAVHSPEDARRMATLILRHTALLHQLRSNTGKSLTLALEPEPCCYIETVDEAISFFKENLWQRDVLVELARELGISVTAAEEVVRHHVGICYDACHMAVEFENVSHAFARFKSEGIRICKIQISSALNFKFAENQEAAEAALRPFADGTYLHQVVEKSGDLLIRYPDLPDALDQLRQRVSSAPKPREWRIHFHVPIFLPAMNQFDTTQDHLVALIDYLKQDPVCPHLEVETYTWDVLPSEYKSVDLVTAIVRELAWVRDRLEA